MAVADVGRQGLGVPYAVTVPDRIPAERYYDADFYAMECELLWPRVWQMACRLEDIPRPGDFVEYRILDKSIIVVRVDAGTVKAYHNACRHRGVQLVKDRGSCASGFVCSFHGWCWGLDGANTFVLQPDVFSADNMDRDDLRLAECRVEVWGGAAFINLDDSAAPLRESIEPFATYHDAWHVDKMRAEWWLQARLPVNWKLAMEAFMEGYHVMETHPQLLPPGVKGRVYYEPGPGGIGIKVRPQGDTTIDSRLLIEMQIHFLKTLNEGMAGMTHEKDVRVAEGLRNIELPADAALANAEWRRRLNDAIVAWNRGAGIDIPDLNELAAQGLTSTVNYCFPHYFLLPMFGNASSYRIRPLGPEECLFDLWSLTLFPEGQEPTPPSTPEPMGPDDPRWPPIPAQDYSNLPRQQIGLHQKGFEFMRLSNQGEGMISNYQRLIDGYLTGVDQAKLVAAAQRVSGPIETPILDIGF